MKNLVFSSLVVLLFSSCAASQYKGFQKESDYVPGTNNIDSWFQGEADNFLFHAGIDLYNNHFGGLIVIKRLVADSYRVVYITEPGIKIFDMEFFKNGEFRLHYCLDAINRKSVINKLRNDFSTMLANLPEESGLEFLTDSQNSRTLIRSKDRSAIRYYILNDKTKRIEEISVNSRFRKKMNLSFYSRDGLELDSINIRHYDMKLSIQLSNLHKNKQDVPE